MPTETPVQTGSPMAPSGQPVPDRPEMRQADDVPRREWFPRRNHMTAEEVYLALLAMVLVVAVIVGGIWWTT